MSAAWARKQHREAVRQSKSRVVQKVLQHDAQEHLVRPETLRWLMVITIPLVALVVPGLIVYRVYTVITTGSN